MIYQFTQEEEQTLMHFIKVKTEEDINPRLNDLLHRIWWKINDAPMPELVTDEEEVPARNPEPTIECPLCGEITFPDAYRTEDEDQFTRICNGCGKVFTITELVDATKAPNPHCWMLMITPKGDYVDLVGNKQDTIAYVNLRKSALGENKEGIRLYAVQELPLTPQIEPKTGGTHDLQEKTDV